MAIALPPRLTSSGVELDLAPNAFGLLRESSALLQDPVAIRERIQEDGYLYLPRFFARDDVQPVRASICEALAKEGALQPGTKTIEAIAKPGISMAFRPDIANANHLLKALIYGPQLIGVFEQIFGEPVRSYDYTWMRAVAPGFGTHAHCDVVYMGRGTHNLLTAWVPLGDVPITTGGLIVLEGSHRYDPIVRNYCQLDVDSTCANQEGENSLSARGFDRGGAITSDPAALRVEQGGRWLTAEFEMGDVLIFSVFLTHASLDNGSNTIRLSSDSRYQPASQPADERWVGDNPPGHGPQSTLEWIC